MSKKLVAATKELMIYLLKEDYQLLISHSGRNTFRPSKMSIDMFFSDDSPIDISDLEMYYIPNIVKKYEYYYREGIAEMQIDMTGIILDDRQ